MTSNVVFGIASYSGSVCHEFQGSMIETIGALARHGIPFSTITASGDPYLSKARNRLVADFLLQHGRATHLFMLDDDIGWPGAKVAEFVLRDLDVIGGVYPKKSDMPQWPMQLETTPDGLPIERGGLYRGLLAPTGFLCIARRALERMAAASEQYRDTTHPTAPPMHWNVFDMGWFMPDGSSERAPGRMGEFWGEDYYFCRRWRDMGGEIWIDPDIQFTHRGSKAWGGSFKPTLDAWIEQQSATAAQPKAAE